MDDSLCIKNESREEVRWRWAQYQQMRHLGFRSYFDFNIVIFINLLLPLRLPSSFIKLFTAGYMFPFRVLVYNWYRRGSLGRLFRNSIFRNSLE
jgi:hypothetical protein